MTQREQIIRSLLLGIKSSVRNAVVREIVENPYSDIEMEADYIADPSRPLLDSKGNVQGYHAVVFPVGFNYLPVAFADDYGQKHNVLSLANTIVGQE